MAKSTPRGKGQNSRRRERVTLSPEYPRLEAATREEINGPLEAVGWILRDKKRLNLNESTGVVVRGIDDDSDPANCMLFVDGKACGIIEAKQGHRPGRGVKQFEYGRRARAHGKLSFGSKNNRDRYRSKCASLHRAEKLPVQDALWQKIFE